MPSSHTLRRQSASVAVVLCLLVAGLSGAVVAAGTGASLAVSPDNESDAGTDSDGDVESDDDSSADEPGLEARNADAPIEDEYVQPVPERGDEYFEAEAGDGSWISYINPRDRYRNPYLGDGSGKICVTLLNEEGEVIVGETVPNTTVTVPTGDSLSWHSYADPMTVEYPLTEHYDRPLDADQFGTNSELPQGDGYLDSHCIEIHGMPDDGGVVEYDEVQIDGEYADWIDVVGYIQQEHQAWDTDVDPIEDAGPYEDAGGWTYEENASHGQAVIVLQLDPPEDAYPEGADSDEDETSETDTTNETSEENDTTTNTTPAQTESATTANETTDEDTDSVVDTDNSSDSDDSSGEEMPGFGVFVALLALSVAFFVKMRR